MTTLLRYFLIIPLFVISFSSLLAQETTVYHSPHDMDNTISKIYFGIDKNGLSYLNTIEYKSRTHENGKYRGRVQVINFESEYINKLAACEPTVMLEMPLKLVVWEEGNDVFIAYTNSMNLKRRHLISDCHDILVAVNKSMIRVVNDAIRTDY